MPEPTGVVLDGAAVPRVLGRAGRKGGPVLVVFGGIHGNEPAGIRAIRRVWPEIERRADRLRGEVVALAGNRAALREGVRFVARDLNRRWTFEGIERVRSADPAGLADEDLEQRAILERLEPVLAHAHEPVTVLDLHSMSGTGAPFCCMSDTLRNLRVGLGLPVPLILGLEEVIDGTMLGYLSDVGHRGIAFEGGRHDDPATVDHHEAAIWLVAARTGLLPAEQVPRLAEHRARLRAACRDLPRVVEVRYRHVVREGDDFEMVPGFRNFDPVRKGQRLATDRRGAVRAPRSGRLLLPRYQGQGEDGFFIGRVVPRPVLRLSRAIRRLGLDDEVARLPFVTRDPVDPDRLVVPRSYLVGPIVDILHLCGYRRRVDAGDRVVFVRRRQDRLL